MQMSFSSSFDIYLIDLILAIVHHLLWQWMQSDFMSLGCFFSLQYESCLFDALETWVVQLLRTFPMISCFLFLISQILQILFLFNPIFLSFHSSAGEKVKKQLSSLPRSLSAQFYQLTRKPGVEEVVQKLQYWRWRCLTNCGTLRLDKYLFF